MITENDIERARQANAKAIIKESRRRQKSLPPPVPKYRCPACGKIVERDSEKQWMNSYCDQAGRTTRLQRQSEKQEQGE